MAPTPSAAAMPQLAVAVWVPLHDVTKIDYSKQKISKLYVVIDATGRQFTVNIEITYGLDRN